jgi:acetyl-CoA carboxylase biotin carboxylase subunit
MELFFKDIKLLLITIVWFAKLICHGRNRTEAIQRMNRSLDEFVIEGITTTIPLHKKLLSHKKFINSDFNVSWLDKDTIV